MRENRTDDFILSGSIFGVYDFYAASDPAAQEGKYSDMYGFCVWLLYVLGSAGKNDAVAV